MPGQVLFPDPHPLCKHRFDLRILFGLGKACCKLLQRGRLALMKHADSVPAQLAEAIERADKNKIPSI